MKKINKKKKLFKNLIIIVFILSVAYIFSGFRPTSQSAHKRLEKVHSYGPSKVVNTMVEKNKVYYLCQYDKWFSMDIVERKFYGVWGENHFGEPKDNDKKKPIITNYTWGGNNGKITWVIWGVINNEEIKKLKLELHSKGEVKVIEKENIEDDMFLFTWEDQERDYKINIKALDETGEVLYDKRVTNNWDFVQR